METSSMNCPMCWETSWKSRYSDRSTSSSPDGAHQSLGIAMLIWALSSSPVNVVKSGRLDAPTRRNLPGRNRSAVSCGTYVTCSGRAWPFRTAGGRWAGVREQPRALADDHGIGEQDDLVDQVVVEQPPEQGPAAVHLQLASRPGFQLADGGRDLTGEDGRVRPAPVGECGRCHVLGLRVQRRPDRAVARIVPRSPGAGEDLVGQPAEQAPVGPLVDLVHPRSAFVVEVGPSAALEYAALRPACDWPAGSLHHSVNGDLRGGRQFHGSSFLSCPGFGVTTVLRC